MGKQKNNKNKTKENNYQHNHSGFVIGILLVVTGIYLYLLSFFPSIAKYKDYLLLIIGLYFVISFWLLKIHKVFFFLGEIFIVLWLGSLLEVIPNKQTSFSIILFLLGLAIVFYATYFRVKIRKKAKSIRFLVVGIIIMLLGTLLFLTTLEVFSFSFLWKLLRPFILILFGVILVNRWVLERQLYKNKESPNIENVPDEDTSNESVQQK